MEPLLLGIVSARCYNEPSFTCSLVESRTIMTHDVSQSAEDDLILLHEEIAIEDDPLAAGPADVAGQPAPRNEALQLLRETVETIVLALIMFLIIRQGIQNYRIESHSMEPNFYENQFVLVNKLAYRLGEPQRGDVVVFHNPNNVKEDYIKRIIGLPGDALEFRDDIVYVNGLPLDEPYTNPPTRAPFGSQTIVVEDDHLFVMGDNRPKSSDSRYFGQLDQDLLVGKPWVRIWPVSEWARVGHIDLVPGQPTTVD